MAESRLDFRKRHVHEHMATDELDFSSDGAGSFVQPRVPKPRSFRENEQNEGIGVSCERLTNSRHAHSISFGGGGEEVAGEPIAVFLLRGRPGSAGGSTMLPGLRDSRSPFHEGTHHGGGDQWNAEVVANAVPESYGAGNNHALRPSAEEVGGAWNSLRHRRVHSAPNIMAGMTEEHSDGTRLPRWRGAGLPCPSSDVLPASLREHAIPEGRRFEALEPPLRTGITPAPGRPRSWRVRTTAPPWGAGPTSVKDFTARDPSNLDWMPKLRASYFVDVRSQEGEAPATTVGGLMAQSPAIGGMASDTRPFEEIKRMRLSQALDHGPQEGTILGLTPSPTYSASARTHFDTARHTPRFSPGKGIKVSGFASSLNCRPTFGNAGLRDGAFGWQPLSPALTEPPTPPPHLDWKMQDPGSCALQVAEGGHLQTRAAEAEQCVLPMEQRPLDEVNAVQALMSVGRGSRTQAESMSLPEQEGDGSASGADDTQGSTPMCETPVPSLERLKPFDGQDDDDGLDKDLWVVVEKGSLCSSADCVYRDPAARIASRRHYHSKCTHTHNGGVKKGMVFHHHQLEKVQKHQRSHKREATKSAPYKRTTPEDHQAMEGAGVEGYRPEDWEPEETRQLDELVNQLVAPVTHAWPSIARFFPTKSSIQCLLHWRFTLNDNGIIRGNGTWGAEEDARLRKLAPVFSSPATGPRWAKIAEVMPGRTAKQCRERYNNHVDPAIKKDKIWTAEEDALVMELHAEHHNQFAKIARRIPGRCYDDVKNRFNLLVKRRQLAGRSTNSGSTHAGASLNVKPSMERTVSTERQARPPDPASPHDVSGPLATSHGGQAQLTSRSGVKRSTPETPGPGEAYVR